MTGVRSWFADGSARSPRRRALRTLLWAAALTVLLALTAYDVLAAASIAELAPVVAVGVAFGTASAIAIGSAEDTNGPIGTPVATLATLVVVLVASVALLLRRSGLAMSTFVLATIWANALGEAVWLLAATRDADSDA